MRIFIAVILILSIWTEAFAADRSKQALRAIEKSEFDKAKELLVRSYDKDSLNPLVSFAYCQLYVSSAYDSYDLDSARLFIKSAFLLLPHRTEDHIEEMDKADVKLVHFDTVKMYVDSLGFARAKKSHGIEDYNHFILRFEDAREVSEAIEIRNALLYEDVQRQNNWQSYLSFFEEYPNAAEAKNAESKYHELIYDEQTTNASTIDLENFLISIPNSPYRTVIEQRIFDAKVSSMNVDSIYAFTHRYSNDSLVKSAMDILYHWDELYRSSLPLSAAVTYQSFIDSVYQIEELNKEILVPFYKDGAYNYHTLNGDVFLENSFDNINLNHLCGNVTDEILEIEIDGVRQLLNRKGDIIYQGTFNGYHDLGAGVVRIEKEGLFGAVHKSGFEILSPIYEELELLNGQLFTVKSKGLVGLASILGKIYVSPKYDRILQKGDFWIVEKDNLFAVSNLKSILSQEESSIELKYEEVELLYEEHMVGYLESTEEIINKELEIISPFGTISAITKYDTWVFKTAEGNYLFDPKSQSLEDQQYQRVLQNEEWLGLFNGFNWEVHSRKIQGEPIINIDSIKLIGRDIVVVFRGSQGTAIFPNGQLIEIKEGQFIRSLRSYNSTKVHYLVVGYQDRLRLYRDGDFLFETDFEEIDYISDSAFTVKRGNKYGAVDQNGKLIMRVKYNAITKATKGVSNVLYNGKFGAFNFEDRILIDLNSEQLLERYNDFLFIQKRNGQYGVISRDNQSLVEATFDQIAYWSDTSFMAKSNDKWGIYRLSDQSELLSNIDSYNYIVNEGGSKIIEFQKEGQYGVYDAKMGVLLPPVYNDIYNLGDQITPLFFAEKRFSEANYYIVAYYDSKGMMIYSMAYRGDEYELIVCDD